MKFFIALPLLAAAALAAPQLAVRNDATNTTKPFMEADPKNNDACWKRRPNHPWDQPYDPTFSEECEGTIMYCLRGYYAKHGEDFSDTDACLRSRGVDPATTADIMRIVSRDDIRKGFNALDEANQIYNRYMLITRLVQTTVSDEKDKEGNAIISQLKKSNEDRVYQARELISNAKSSFGRGYGSQHDAKIGAAIDEAKGKLNAAWIEIRDKDVKQLASMNDWFNDNSAEKYYHHW